MAQKIIKIGSSSGVTLPASLLEHLHSRVSDFIELRESEEGVLIIPAKKDKKSHVDKDLLQWAEDAIEKYRPALEALADK